MKTGVLEHVNLTVTDPERTAQILCDLFGWTIRWSGPSKMGGRTVHVGGEDSYIAVYRLPDGAAVPAGAFNHVGVVVDDLDAVEARVKRAGLEPYSHADYEPGRRFYFFDPDGLEYEVISYSDT